MPHHFCPLLQISDLTNGPAPHPGEGAFRLPQVLLVLHGQAPAEVDPQQGHGTILLDLLISPLLLRRRSIKLRQCLRLISNSLFGLPHIYSGFQCTNDVFNTFLLSLYLPFSLFQLFPEVAMPTFRQHENFTHLT